MTFSPGDLIVTKKRTESLWFQGKTAEPELSSGPLIKKLPILVLEVYENYFRNVHTEEPMSDMLTVFSAETAEVHTGVMAINYEYPDES
tara:strand:- start:210 stop:476 length:267 start_codon:yes stop_codon:yes gene_type:complete